MLASTIQFSSYGQNQPHNTHQPPTPPAQDQQNQKRYECQANPSPQPPPGRPALKKQSTCVARSLRTQQRAQTTPPTTAAFHPGKPEVLTTVTP
jgi:hypothetical protein